MIIKHDTTLFEILEQSPNLQAAALVNDEMQ